VTEDREAISALLKLVGENLISVGSEPYVPGSGGGNLRTGILFGKDGAPIDTLYVARAGTHGASRGVFSDGWISMKSETRKLIESWVVHPGVKYVGSRGSGDPPPCTEEATGVSVL